MTTPQALPETPAQAHLFHGCDELRQWSGLRLDVLRECPPPCPGVTAWRRETVRLPARDVLAAGLGSLDAVTPSPRRGRRAAPPDVERRIVYRTADGPVEATHLAALGPAALHRFLRDALERTSEPELQHLQELAREERGGRHAWHPALASALDPDQRHGRYGPRGGQGALFERTVFEHEHPVELRDDGGALRGPAFGDCAATVVREVPVRGHLVPRRAYVVSSANGRAFVHDGLRLRRARTLDDVDDDLAAALDRAGVVAFGAANELLPLGHLRARCLVRVPPRDAVAPRLAAARSARRPRSRHLAHPALCLSSLEPVPLTGRELVLDDPDVAAWVLTRTANQVYLPHEQAPRRLQPDAVEPEGAWLVLCDAGLGL